MRAAGGAAPATVRVAGLLAAGYALVLLAVGGTLVGEFLTGRGRLGAEHLTGRAAEGVVEVSVLLGAGAALLTAGAVRVLRRRGRALLVAPLAVLLVVGSIGEVTDAVGDAGARSDLIGLAILALAALPVVLLRTRTARGWFGR